MACDEMLFSMYTKCYVPVVDKRDMKTNYRKTAYILVGKNIMYSSIYPVNEAGVIPVIYCIA